MLKEKETEKDDYHLDKFKRKLKEASRRKVVNIFEGSTSSPHSLVREYLKRHIKEGKSIGLPREIKYDLRDKIGRDTYKSILENAYNRLSKTTQDEIKRNYDQATIKEILESLLNFESAILISEKVPILAKEIKEWWLDINQASRDIDSLLKNKIIAESLKNTLRTQKEDLENFLNMSKKVKLNPIQLTKLYDMLLDPMGLSYFFRYDFDIILNGILFLIPQQQKGRPSIVFFKALQIIIHKLLTIKPPLKITRHVVWAKKLTAIIINDFFARWRDPSFYANAASDSGVGVLSKNVGPWKLPELTAKDIDNSLHSSS